MKKIKFLILKKFIEKLVGHSQTFMEKLYNHNAVPVNQDFVVVNVITDSAAIQQQIV